MDVCDQMAVWIKFTFWFIIIIIFPIIIIIIIIIILDNYGWLVCLLRGTSCVY